MGKEMSKILPGLYLGRLDNAQNDNDMMANCITHVLSVHEPVKQKLQKFKSYEYFEVNVKDEENACISKYFSKTNDFIHEARMKNGNVLIHCLAGVSRAPTIVLAYLMTVYELSFQDAYSCLKSVRRNINPIPTFVKQLNDFENNDVSQERERLIATFGVYQHLEEDKKLIAEFIDQYENRETDDYIDNSIDSTTYDEMLNSDRCHNPLEDSHGLSDLNNGDSDGGLLGMHIPHLAQPVTPDDRQSEEEVDIPGSIPIGAVQASTISNQETTSSDFRGRAHSRGHVAAPNIDRNPLLSRYGQTAPPSLPLFFTNSD